MWIRTVEFRQALGGYDRGDVDEVLEKVAKAVDAGWPPKTVIRDVHFRRTRGKGYHRRDIDEFMDLLRTSEDFVGVGDPLFPPPRAATEDPNARVTNGPPAGKRRERKRQERAATLSRERDHLAKSMEFPSLPGTHIRCRRSADSKYAYEFYRVGTETPLAIAHYRRRTYWNPTEVVIAGVPYVVKRHGWSANTRRAEVIDSRTDRTVLTAKGQHFDHSHSTEVFLSDNRTLTFPVEGEAPWFSEMTAIDGESKTWIRFRWQINSEKARNDVEKMLICVEPDVTLSTELLLTIVLVAGSLISYFKEPAGSGA